VYPSRYALLHAEQVAGGGSIATRVVAYLAVFGQILDFNIGDAQNGEDNLCRHFAREVLHQVNVLFSLAFGNQSLDIAVGHALDHGS
jgi:hypothetical protein